MHVELVIHYCQYFTFMTLVWQQLLFLFSKHLDSTDCVSGQTDLWFHDFFFYNFTIFSSSQFHDFFSSQFHEFFFLNFTIFFLGEDDLGASGDPSGAAGSRLACCIITPVPDPPHEFETTTN